MADEPQRDLIAAHWLAAGQRPAADPAPCAMSLRERARAVAAAGYAGIGILAAELAREVAAHGTAGVRAIIEDAGLRHVEIEALSDWWLPGDAWPGVLGPMLEQGAAIGARTIKATGDFSASPAPLERMAQAFAPVAAMARDGGVPIALEVIAFSNVRNIPDAITVLGDAAGRGAGLMLDSWHFGRLGVSLAPLRGLPEAAILGVEISGVDSVPHDDMFRETLDARCEPDRGRYDVGAFLGAVSETGYAGPIGVEVLCAGLRELPVVQALARCQQAARRVASIATT
ncbi:MAG: TIM barrel protein [Novosphingobium sp.]